MKKLALIFLFLLLPLLVHAGAIQKLIDDGSLVLYHNYAAGHALDLSGQGNDGTPSGVVWSREGARFGAGTSSVDVADSASIRMTEFALVLFSAMEFGTPTTEQDLIAKFDGTGKNFQLRLETTPRISLLSDLSNRNLAVDVDGKHFIGINAKSGETPEGFLDGVTAGNFSGAWSCDTGAETLRIGSRYFDTNRLESTLSAALIFNRELTATEHAAVYAELIGMRWPQKQDRGEAHYMGRQLLLDGAAAYTPGNTSAVITDIEDGIRVGYGGGANPIAAQLLMEVGKKYRIIGEARGDGTVYPFIKTGGTVNIFSGTPSTAWQTVDEVFTTDSNTIYLRMIGASGFVEFRNIEVREVISTPRTEWDDRRDGTLEWGTDWGTPVTPNQTAGQMVGPFEIISGTHKVVTREVDGKIVKAIQRVVNGGVAISSGEMRQTPSDAAFGTWEWGINRPTSGVIYLAPISGGTDATAGGAYSIRLLADGSISLYENGVGSLIAGAGAITDGVDHVVRLTRSAAGLFALYVDGVLIGTATDLTVVVSAFLAITMTGAACEVNLADVGGSHAFNKFQGAVSP